MARVRAAPTSQLDPAELTPDERAIYDDLVMDQFADLAPTPASEAFYAHFKTRVGSVGYDDQRRLVRRREDGTDETLG